MTFKTSYNSGLGQPALTLTGVDTVARVAIGTVIKGYDDTQGEGEFIYLPGAANVVAGDCVVYDLNPSAPIVARATAAAQANAGQACAFAVVAVPAGSYGWYQVSGCAIVNTIAGTGTGKAYLSATAGQLTFTPAAGAQIMGARISSAVGTPAAGQSYATLNRPCVQGQIT